MKIVAKRGQDNARPYALSFNFETPMEEEAHVLANYNSSTGNGTFAVTVLRTMATAEKFLCRVDNAPNIDMPAMYNPAGLSMLTRRGMTEFFENLAVPATVPNTMDPVAPSMEVPGTKYAKVASYRADDTRLDQEAVEFTPMPPIFNTTVSSKACLWLAFAEDTFVFDQPGDHGESVAQGYRPTTLVIPHGAIGVQIEADPADTWAHHPTTDRQSNAAGLNPTALTKPHIYKANRPGLNSSKIDGTLEHPFNALVAALDNGGKDVDTVIQLVGLNSVLNGLSASTKRVFLGFHDSYEWSNNTRPDSAFTTVKVKLTWRFS